jgi:hypothetical protein
MMTISCLGQNTGLDYLQEISVVGDLLEEKARDQDSETPDPDWADELSELAENRVNLNSQDIGRLTGLSLITEYQENKIREYRLIYGDFLTVYELRFIEGLDDQTIQHILPFVSVEPQKESNPQGNSPKIAKPRQKVTISYGRILERQNGYVSLNGSSAGQSSETTYNGSPDKISFRYMFDSNPLLKFGFIIRKSPGEPFFTSDIKSGIKDQISRIKTDPLDIVAGCIQFTSPGIIKSVCLGNFGLQVGQGVTLWSGSGMSGLSGITTIRKQARGLKAVTNPGTSQCFRGIGVTLEIKRWSVIPFISYKKIDAGNIIIDSASGKVNSFGSIRNTGLYRTNSEIAGRNSVREFAFGGTVRFQNNFMKAGITGVRNSFNARLIPQETDYGKFRFSGTTNWAAGTDLEFFYHNFQFYGELSFSANGTIAGMAGLLFKPVADIDISILYRNFPKTYQNGYGSGFKSGGRNSNEKGLYLGFAAIFPDKWKLSAYADFSHYSWLSYDADAPKSQSEYFVQAEKFFSDNTYLALRIRYKNQAVNQTSDFSYIHPLINEKNLDIRLQLDFPASPSIKLRSRLEWVNYCLERATTSKGIVIFQDFCYQPLKFPVKFWLRICLFNTDGYDSRIYSFENNMPYVYSVPAYFDKGSRAYLLVSYRLTKILDFWLRYDIFIYSNRRNVGSGPDEIAGNRKSGISAQLMLSL